jgi:hypothetical protein
VSGTAAHKWLSFRDGTVTKVCVCPIFQISGVSRSDQGSAIRIKSRNCAEVTLTRNGNCPKLDFFYTEAAERTEAMEAENSEEAFLQGHVLFRKKVQNSAWRRASVSRLAGFHSSIKTANFQRTGTPEVSILFIITIICRKCNKKDGEPQLVQKNCVSCSGHLVGNL